MSQVNGETNSLLYRGYPLQEPVATCRFDEVVHLLYAGDDVSRAS